MTDKVNEAISRSTTTLKGSLQGGFQYAGQKWMLEREFDTSNIKGGILADDMGLGKTMQAIATMHGNPCPYTLIVTMVATVGQWKDALIDFGGYKPIIVTPSFMGILPPIDDFKEMIVLTSYSSFQKSRGKSPSCLKEQAWDRVILDEGHIIRNPKTKVFKEINSIVANIKWVLSGTPIQNTQKDMWSLARWIGIDESLSIEDFCKKYVLRRTQAEACLDIPALETKVLKLSFNDVREAKLYDVVETYYRERLLKKENESTSSTMEGIIRCRQVCTHPLVYISGCQSKALKNEGATCRKRRLDDEEDIVYTGFNIFEKGREIVSSKVSFLCQDIKKHKEKTLIFCSWILEMRLIQKSLKDASISSMIFDGSLSRDSKDNVLYNFKNSIIPVLILQINCGSTGLNLQCASRVYIMNPHYNPCMELQAIGRAYRKGQTKTVVCTRLVMNNTIDERCLDIQTKKTKIIMNAMMDETLQSKLGSMKEETLNKVELQDLLLKKNDVSTLEDIDDKDIVNLIGNICNEEM